MKKVFSIVLTAVLLLSLTACAGAKPEAVVTDLCDAMQKFDVEAMSACFVDPTQIDLPDMAMAEEEEIIRLLADYLTGTCAKMTYTIGDITTAGDTATVPVTFAYVDAGDVVSETLLEAVSRILPLALQGATEEEMEVEIAEIFAEKMQTVETATAMTQVTFPCVKADGKWKIGTMGEDAQKEFTAVISSNISKAIQNMNDLLGLD